MITEEYLIEKFIENKWNPIDVTCPDGANLLITPCSQGSGNSISSISEVEYFLVDGDLPWLGGSNLSTIVSQINDHAEMVADSDREKKELREYYDKYAKDNWPEDSWDFYSDWHKDLYGFRPSMSEEPGLYITPADRYK